MIKMRDPLGILAVCVAMLCAATAMAAAPETVHPALEAAGVVPAAAGIETAVHAVKADGTCVPGPWTLCLNDARFSVEVTWTDFDGNSGPGWVAPLPAASSGLFWFFDDDNLEILVKVLDGCGFNDHFWVFSAATTNLD